MRQVGQGLEKMAAEVNAEIVVLIIFGESKLIPLGPVSNIKNLHSGYKHL